MDEVGAEGMAGDDWIRESYSLQVWKSRCFEPSLYAVNSLPEGKKPTHNHRTRKRGSNLHYAPEVRQRSNRPSLALLCLSFYYLVTYLCTYFQFTSIHNPARRAYFLAAVARTGCAGGNLSLSRAESSNFAAVQVSG